MIRAQSLQVSDSGCTGSTRKVEILEALSRAGEVFKQALPDDFLAMEFLRSRCGLSANVIEEYSIGVSSTRSWGRLDPRDIPLLAAAGLIGPGKRNSGRKKSCDIVLPVCDKKSRTVGFIVQPANEPGRPMKASYSTGDSALLRSSYAVFGLDMAFQAIQVGQPIVLVSSALEVLCLAQRDLRGAVAPLSLPFSPHVIETLQSYSKDIIIVCSGNREMVVSALDAALAKQGEGISIQFSFISRDMKNCIEFLQFKGPDAFIDALERSTPTVDLLYRRLITSPNVPASNKGKWVVSEGRKFFDANPSESVRSRMLLRLEDLAGVRPAAPPGAPSSAAEEPSNPPSAARKVKIGLVDSDRGSTKPPVGGKPSAAIARVASKSAPTSAKPPSCSDKADKTRSTKSARPPVPTPPWVSKLLVSELYIRQKANAGRMSPDDVLVSRALSIIATTGARVTVARLASELNIPAFRGRGLVAGLRRVMNVDGNDILSLEESTSTVILDRTGLLRHFNIVED